MKDKETISTVIREIIDLFEKWHSAEMDPALCLFTALTQVLAVAILVDDESVELLIQEAMTAARKHVKYVEEKKDKK